MQIWIELEWRYSRRGKVSRQRAKCLQDAYPNGTCVIICNGPSLSITDMSLISKEISFAFNRSYLLFSDWGFIPNFFVVSARNVLQEFAADLRNVKALKFFSFDQARELQEPSIIGFKQNLALFDRFSKNLDRGIWGGGTVTFAALQIAFHMGFRHVVIIGMDHHYSAKGTPTESVVRKEELDIDHPHPDYFPKGVRWELPDLRRSEIAYAIARKEFEDAGGGIIDATIGGKCDVFEKMELEAALECVRARSRNGAKRLGTH